MKQIGFIGQGWIGKNYADDFEKRGYDVVRYALEEPYKNNKSAIKSCEIVFVAVPTPTTKNGFDDSFLHSAFQAIGKDTVVVVKSTIPVGTTKALQAQYTDFIVVHSPEFLREVTAANDAAHPERNIIGIPEMTEEMKVVGEEVLAVLPLAPYQRIIDANDAELIKYAGNCFLYSKILFINQLYDLVQKSAGNWESVREALVHDPRIGSSHTEPVHVSGHDTKGGKSLRGAGGHCFIKDFEVFREMYKNIVGDECGERLLEAQSKYNRQLLVQSGKDLDLVKSVFGDQA